MTDHHEFRPEKLLCVVAHPDDIEVTIGASIAKWIDQGTEVCYLVCTDGANGTDDVSKTGEATAKTRMLEQMGAAKAVGAHCWHQLEFSDGKVELNDDLRQEIVRHIRCHKPDTVFTMDPTFLYSTQWNYPNHRDHRVVGQAAFDAVYPMARDIGSCVDVLNDGLEPHAVDTLIMTNFEKQNYYVDVTNHFDKKVEALKAHVSQFGDAAGVADWQRRMCAENGQQAGCELAESFVKLSIFS